MSRSRQNENEENIFGKYGTKEKTNWRDRVKELKGLGTISTHISIPEEYKGYPGIRPYTISGSLGRDNNFIYAKRMKNGIEERQRYIVNINDLYDDSEQHKRIENSIELYELFKGEAYEQ